MVWQKAIAFLRKFYRQTSMKTIKVGLFWLLICCLIGCQQLNVNNFGNSDRINNSLAADNLNSDLAEVASPKIIKDLSPSLDRYYPQVEIVTPKSEQTIDQTEVRVELEVEDLPLFQDRKWGLGNHLNLIVDNEPFQVINNIDRPITIKNLAPGSHTIRAFAVTPWGESFKNEGAYAQTTFNVLTETNDNRPDPNAPLLTYNTPTGIYGAEPILLDFYLTNAPLHAIAQNDNDTQDWRIRATIDGTSFTIDDWQPIYLTGLKSGDNWVQLELIDEQGNDIENVFNNTVRVINYDTQQQDSLAQLISNKISLNEARSLVEPNSKIEPEAIGEDLSVAQSEPQVIDNTSADIAIESQPEVANPINVNSEPTVSFPKESDREELGETSLPQSTPLTILEPVAEPTIETEIAEDSLAVNEPELSEVREKITIIEADSAREKATIAIPQPESVEIAESEITITIPDRPKPDPENLESSQSRSPWWKKILVGLRHQIEALARQLPDTA